MGSFPTRTKDDFLIFGAPQIQQDEIDEVVDSMTSGWLGTGPKVNKFEMDMCSYLRAKHAVAVNSCTAALHLSLIAAGIKPGDEVITTPLTFCATLNAIIHSGGTPVLADVNPVSMNIDPDSLEKAISPRTKAILPVHFAGRPCDMEQLCFIAQKHNLMIIEDCAHAIETKYKGQHAGTFGDFSCFSFYVTKNVVAGEGGMVIIQKERDAARIKTLALHGMSKDAWARFSDEGYKHYLVTECGFKYNMMDIQAAIALHQLARVEENWKRRQDIWVTYNQAFADLPVVLPADIEPETKHAYHLYTILVDERDCGISRDEFLTRMTKMNIGVGVHYLSIPEHPYYQQRFGWQPDDYPHARHIGRTTVSLPLSAKLTDEDVQDVIKSVRTAMELSF